MRKVQGTLAFAYTPNDRRVLLDGSHETYLFDKGLEFDGVIEAGSFVTLTLISVPGPNPARSSKAFFEVERIAAIHVSRPAGGVAAPTTVAELGWAKQHRLRG